MKLVREKIEINGIVQGVGFRPYVYNLAKSLSLSGYVVNNSQGVIIEIEGELDFIQSFHEQLQTTPPPLSKITYYKNMEIDICHDTEFCINESNRNNLSTTFISPDIATCDDCLSELFDPLDRRYLYPFINCTNCGPRNTIVKNIPYDRVNTSMSDFLLCDECLQEYKDPTNRRFHAQPNACQKCGPTLSLYDKSGKIETDNPINEIIKILQLGNIVAIKGLGGFHLSVDSNNTEAIKNLRICKSRAEKPFALMAKDLETVKKYCYVSKDEEYLLISWHRPIVLLQKKETCTLPDEIAPHNNYLGFMLPYTPLHHLLFHNSFDTLVMTSANLSEEPIAIDNNEAIERLSSIADYFLMHNRDILQRCDDSIVRISNDSCQFIRRSRGYVPLPIFTNLNSKDSILAVGAEQKNSIAISRNNSVFLSQYIGDLDNPESFTFFINTISHFSKLLETKPSFIACDMHPEYLSTKWAKEQNLDIILIQHHHAHMVSVMTENNCTDKAIGIILDGTGYGIDNTIWGGEVLIGDAFSYDRFAWLKPVPLPGGSTAIKEPWRIAFSYLYQIYGKDLPLDIPFLKSLDTNKRNTVSQMIDKKINSPMTSGCGRLFDAVSALLNINSKVTYDAQAAIELEMCANDGIKMEVTKINNLSGSIDCSDIIKKIVSFIRNKQCSADIALYFHQELAEYFVASACKAREDYHISTVALSGGVFQNKTFFEYLYNRLQEESFNILIHKELPTNDGGIALGQIMIADAKLTLQNNEVQHVSCYPG